MEDSSHGEGTIPSPTVNARSSEADVAAPAVGGLATSLLMELLV